MTTPKHTGNLGKKGKAPAISSCRPCPRAKRMLTQPALTVQIKMFGAERYGKTSNRGKVLCETAWNCQFLNQLSMALAETPTHMKAPGTRLPFLIQMHYLEKQKFINSCRNSLSLQHTHSIVTQWHYVLVSFWCGSDTVSRCVHSTTVFKNKSAQTVDK